MPIRKRRARFLAAAFAALVGAAMATSACAQQALTVEIIRGAPLAKDALFTQTVLWIAENFRSAREVIQLQDRDLGTIVGNGTFDISISAGIFTFTPPVNMPVTYRVRIDVRDNRYRMTFSDVRYFLDGASRTLDYTDRDSNERRLREHFEQLANSLDQYLARPIYDF